MLAVYMIVVEIDCVNPPACAGCVWSSVRTWLQLLGSAIVCLQLQLQLPRILMKEPPARQLASGGNQGRSRFNQ